MSTITQIPKDVLRIIIQLLDPKGFHSLALTSRLFRKLCSHHKMQTVIKLRFLKRVEGYHGTFRDIYHIFPSGAREGMRYLFLSNGRLYETSTWSNGKLHGYVEQRDELGNVTHRCEWRNGYKHGLERNWYRRVLIASTNWRKGLPHGIYIQYQADGSIRTRENWINGEPGGIRCL